LPVELALYLEITNTKELILQYSKKYKMHFLYSIYYELNTESASHWLYYIDILRCTINKTLILNNSPHYLSCTGYVKKDTEETVNTKSLGLWKDNHLNWNNHNDQIIPKLCGSHYAFKLTFQVSNITQNVKGNLLYTERNKWPSNTIIFM
jgi:hypothetical protein